jgi:hypothetical protein
MSIESSRRADHAENQKIMNLCVRRSSEHTRTARSSEICLFQVYESIAAGILILFLDLLDKWQSNSTHTILEMISHKTMVKIAIGPGFDDWDRNSRSLNRFSERLSSFVKKYLLLSKC